MEATAQTDHSILLRYGLVWREQSNLPIDEWLKANISLDTTSPIQGPYDVVNSPQMREPLRSFQDDAVRMVTTVGPNQGGRTKAMEGASLWSVVNRPGPMQWNTYKDESAREFAEQRWWQMAKSSPAIVAMLPAHGTGLGPERHKERIRSVIFNNGMPFKIQGCAESNLEEKSIMTQFNDECWQWPVGRLEIAHIRCNVAYAWNYKVWNGSIPGVDGDDFDLLFRSGSQHEWHWRCLKCGREQRPKWGKMRERGGIQWERDAKTRPNDREWDYEEVSKTVRYTCQYCEADFADNSRARRQLNDVASYVQLNAGAPNWHHSYRFNILSVNWPGVTWAQWVVEFLKSVDQSRRYGNHEPLRKFWTRRMSEPWDESRYTSTARRIVLSDYKLGEPNIYLTSQWEQEKLRFMAVDKQEWGYPFVIRACAANGDSRLVGSGVGESTCLTSYEDVDAKAREFGVQPQCVLIDCGFEAREVYAQAVRYGWTCMRGVDRETAFSHYREVIDPRTKMITRTAIELPYSGEQWADPFSGTALQQINRRMRQIASAPRLARRFDWINLHIKNMLNAFKQGSAIYWGVPSDVGSEYMRQLNSEVRHVIINLRAKRTEWWSNTNAKGGGQRRPNHAWDCECMIVVAMCLQNLIDLSGWQPDVKSRETDLSGHPDN
jgi:phage terminase large subunit GpA-like protein